MISKADFVHLHNHTQYSKFDGLSSIEEIVSKAKTLGMKHVGLTDHGTFAGAIQFLKACREKEINPVLGQEFYFSKNHCCKDNKTQPNGRKGNRHLNIFAKNLIGYQNLCTLSQEASVNGYYYDPRIDFELLSKYSEGLIVTSACLSSIINKHLSIDKYDEAKKSVAIFKDIFGDDFYLEMMFHGIDLEGYILPQIQKLSKEMNVKVIVTNDSHYPEKKDAEFHQILMCMSSGRALKDPKRLKFPYDEFYFKTQEEMYEIFWHVPEYMKNTIDLAEKCDYSDIVFVENGGQMQLPKFNIPEQFKTPHEYLTHLAFAGLKKYGLDTKKEHVDRLNYELNELKIIWDTKRYDFSTYLLIVDDMMRYAKQNDISAGIRGSGYGSLIVKALGISEGVDPVYSGLLFERFIGTEKNIFICEDDFGIL